jgi:hypothetical protein
VVLDFVIVVMGVFIGIQVSNWNQFAGERRSEGQYLRQLRGDLHNIQAEIDAQIEFEQFHTQLANDVFEIIRNDASETRAQKINVGLTELTVRRTLRIQSPTFLNLQGAGKLEIISDADLRAAIISYFYGVNRLEAAIDKNNGFFVDEGFYGFIQTTNIPPRNWDSDLMGKPLPSSARTPSPFAEMAEKSPLYFAESAGLAAPPDDGIWQEIVPQLAWRGFSAVANESLAQQLRAATDDLDANLARRLERRAP